MPIILAIEPDRRQAAHLSVIVRHQVGAELILADTTEGALDAIGNRVPDLVLVPALLSPTDDAALAAALRVIAAAAHVRTLTIPVLASGTAHQTPGGLLAKWRKRRETSPEPDGCDPAVFGEQIATYLRESAAERATLDDDPFETAASIPTEAIVPAAEPIEELVLAVQPVEELVLAVQPIEELAPAVEPIEELVLAVQPIEAIVPAVESIEELALVVETAEEIELDEERVIDLSDEVAELSDEPEDELFDGEPVAVYTLTIETGESPLDGFDLLPALVNAPASAPESAILTAAVISNAIVHEPFIDSPEPPRADIEPWVPMYLTPGRMWPALEGMPSETPVPRSEQPDWIELVASLRQDLERRRIDPPLPAHDPIAARPSDGAESEAPRAKKQKTPVKKSKPIQDEWGFFDPEQCGFSTLLAKLEEITEEGAGG
jgi:hypothetical protein